MIPRGHWVRRIRCATTTVLGALLAANTSAGGLWINEFGSPDAQSI